MSNKAKVLASLYRRGKISKDGLLEAVEKGVITQVEYIEIVGVE